MRKKLILCGLGLFGLGLALTVFVSSQIRESNTIVFSDEDTVLESEEWPIGPAKEAKHVVIDDTIVTIADASFRLYFGNLKTVEMADSVTTIGSYAFSSCDKLTSVQLSNSLESIGENAFYSCESLKSIEIPDSVTEIGEDAFNGCSSLKNVELSSSLTRIEGYTFYGCTSLKSIEIPDSVTEICEFAFGGCDNLTSITIPESVVVISDITLFVNDNITIYGYTGSYAEKFALTWDIEFVAID